MEAPPLVDQMSIAFFIFTTVLSTLISWHLTDEIWSSLSLGILCGAMFWASYLAIRWIYLSLKK